MFLTRRNFLTWSASVAAGAGLTACAGRQVATQQPAAPTTASTTASTTSSTDAASSTTAPTTPLTSLQTSVPVAPATSSVAVGERVLVVVQLSGGNDGLNTLVPLDGRYHSLRPTIGLADDTLLAIPGTDRYGLHPSLAPMQSMVSGGQVAAVASIAFPHPTRSHFTQLDDWWSATPGMPSTTGWLGRYLDVTGGTASTPLRAVALGSGVPALLGTSSRATVVLSPKDFTFTSTGQSKSGLLDAWKLMQGQRAGDAIAAVDVFGQIKLATDANIAADGEGGNLSKLLATAAELIISGHGARVIHISGGGFDTHSGQLARQAVLLDDLAKGIKHFSERLAAAGMADKALVMTTSEFGRRAMENGSGGTDHGKAGVQFLIGPMVKGGLVGATDLGSLDDGDIKPTIDVRSLYSTALDWLNGPTEQILMGRFDSLGVL